MAEANSYQRCEQSTKTEVKEKKKRIKKILKTISKCTSGVYSHDSSEATTDQNVTREITILDVDRDIFSWSLVMTDFEQFSSFLPLLKQSNTFLRSIEHEGRTCIKCHLEFKRLLWSLFSSFGHKSVENSSDNTTYTSLLRTDDSNKAINYYKSILKLSEQQKYQHSSFIERFRILARITKICPVRLDLLNRLHEELSGGIEENSALDTNTYRLFATIIIDRHSTKYCRLRLCTVHGDFDTSRLTRMYGEDSFLRVNLVQTSTNLDTACRLAFYWEFLDSTPVDLKVNSLVHNVSVLIHTMRDLGNTIPQRPEIASNIENELNEENVHRLNKDVSNGLAQWFTSDFDCLEEQALIHDHFVSLTNDEYSSTANSIDVSSLKIADRCFRYLTTTSTGVHKNTHIYSVKTHESIRKTMFSDDFVKEHKSYELKLALRMGLWFTPSMSMNLKEVEVIVEEDIEKHTDGCGRVSIALAREMSTRWREGKKHRNAPFSVQGIGPTAWNSGTFQDSEIEYDEKTRQPDYYSAFQVRLDGMKGMLVVDSSLGGNKCIRPSRSQVKFISPEMQGNLDYKTIEMVQCSQPMLGARLNLALISLIVACAENPEKMQEYIISLATNEIKKLLSEENRRYAIEFALKHNDVKSFNMLGAGCSALETFLAGYYQNYTRRFKILVEKSRRLFGAADFWGVLKEGEVFVSMSNISTGPSVSEHKVLVTKEPCFHRGDLRTFRAVTKDEVKRRERGECLAELQNVIVFSCCRGERSEPDKICGSDLDGDQYFVCWDEDIVQQLKKPLFQPGDFNPVTKENLEEFYQRQVTHQAKNIIRQKENQEKCGENNVDQVYAETKRSPSILCADDEQSIRRHFRPTKEYEDDLEEQIHRLSHFGHEDKNQTTNNVEILDEPGFDIAEISNNAARKATTIAANSVYFSVSDIFDIYMRKVDTLSTQWTTNAKWDEMEKLCRIIATVLDSAKTDVMTFKKPVIEELESMDLPKYPHFDPSKRKTECKHSVSPLGQIYDTLRKELGHYLPEYSLPSNETSKNTDQTCRDALYDEISELKLSFLLHHTKSQFHRNTDTGIERNDRSKNSPHQDLYANSNLFDALPDSVIPRVHLKDINEWYKNDIKPLTNVNLMKKEAACTILWKVITLLNLTANASSRLRVLYLNEQESLNDVQSEDITYDGDINRPFLCITQPLYEDLQQISSEPFLMPEFTSKTFFTLEQHNVTALIERVGVLIEKTFWRDLKLPYPDCVRRTRLTNLGSELKFDPITFDSIRTLFDIQNQKCLQKPVVTGMPVDLSILDDDDDDDNDHSSTLPNLQEIDIRESNNPPVNRLSKLRDILGCLLCFSEAWNTSSPENFLCSIYEKISQTSLHHLQMYKYQKVLQNVHDTLNNFVELENFPRCSWDGGRIDLSRLELVNKQMQELFELLFS